jgi:hypothetical protein
MFLRNVGNHLSDYKASCLTFHILFILYVFAPFNFGHLFSQFQPTTPYNSSPEHRGWAVTGQVLQAELFVAQKV